MRAAAEASAASAPSHEAGPPMNIVGTYSVARAPTCFQRRDGSVEEVAITVIESQCDDRPGGIRRRQRERLGQPQLIPVAAEQPELISQQPRRDPQLPQRSAGTGDRVVHEHREHLHDAAFHPADLTLRRRSRRR